MLKDRQTTQFKCVAQQKVNKSCGECCNSGQHNNAIQPRTQVRTQHKLQHNECMNVAVANFNCPTLAQTYIKVRLVSVCLTKMETSNAVAKDLCPRSSMSFRKKVNLLDTCCHMLSHHALFGSGFINIILRCDGWR